QLRARLDRRDLAIRVRVTGPQHQRQARVAHADRFDVLRFRARLRLDTLRAGMDERGEPLGHGVDAVDPDATRERADRLAIAEVDADVAAPAPDDDVAPLAVAGAREVMAPRPPIKRVARPVRPAADLREQAGLGV